MSAGKLLRWARRQILKAKAPPAAPPKPPAAPAPNSTLQLPHPDGLTPHRTSIDFIGAEQFSIGRAVLASGFASYEPEVFSLIGALIETSARPVQMLDIGANVGVFSLAMAGLFGDAVRVTSFEPMPELAAFLRDAAARNHVTIDVKQMALGTQDTQAKFYLSDQSDASNSLNESFRAHERVIDVDVRTLDSLLADEEHTGGYVLKLDTESTEPDVLAGARAFIAKHRPPIICEVLAGRTEEKIDSFFRELGYLAIHITHDPMWAGTTTIVGDSTYKFRDWLFLPAPASEALRTAFARWMSAVQTWSTAPMAGSPDPVPVFALVAGEITIRNQGTSAAVRWGQLAPRFAIQYFDSRNYRRKPLPESAKLRATGPVNAFTVSGAIRQIDGAPVVADLEVFAYGEDGELSGQVTKRMMLTPTSSSFSVDVASNRPAAAYRIRWWFKGNGPAAVELGPIAARESRSPAPAVVPIVVRYGHREVRFASGGSVEPVLRRGQFYEAEFLQYIESLGLSGAYVDAGAYVGTHSLFFASFCPASRVYAFEPLPLTFRELSANTALNPDSAKRITLINRGLSEQRESLTITFEGKSAAVECERLDEAVTERVSLIKIDVEGMEHKVLGGATKLLQRDQPLVLLEAHTQAELEKNLALLTPHGYRLTGRIFNASPTYEFATPDSPTAPIANLPEQIELPELLLAPHETRHAVDHQRAHFIELHAPGEKLSGEVRLTQYGAGGEVVHETGRSLRSRLFWRIPLDKKTHAIRLHLQPRDGAPLPAIERAVLHVARSA